MAKKIIITKCEDCPYVFLSDKDTGRCKAYQYKIFAFNQQNQEFCPLEENK
jgi:hypothetical protein